MLTTVGIAHLRFFFFYKFNQLQYNSIFRSHYRTKNIYVLITLWTENNNGIKKLHIFNKNNEKYKNIYTGPKLYF